MSYKKLLVVLGLMICLTGCGASSGVPDSGNTPVEQNDDNKKQDTDKEDDKTKTPIAAEGKIGDIEYTISQGDPYESKYSEMGYIIDTENRSDAPYYYRICAGAKGSSANTIEVEDIQIDDDRNVSITVKETKPGVEDNVTLTVMTYPNVIVSLKPYPESIVIKDTEGNEYKEIK